MTHSDPAWNDILFKVTPVPVSLAFLHSLERENTLERISACFPQWPGAYYEQALFLLDSGSKKDVVEAITILEKAIKSDKNRDFAELWVERGNAYMVLKILGDQERSETMKKNDSFAEIDQATKQAERSYKKALSLKPEDLGALTSLGLLYFKENQLNSALECFETALHVCGVQKVSDKTKGDIHSNLAACFLALSPPEPEQALVHFDKAILLDESNYKKWADKGALCCQMGYYEEGSIQILHALRLNPPEEMTQLLNRLLLKCTK